MMRQIALGSKLCHGCQWVLLALVVFSCSDDSGDTADSRIDAQCVTASEGIYPDQPSSPYVLPWRVGEAYEVSQGNCTNQSHRVALNQQFAYDFAMPVGTRVSAIRSGVVVAVVELFSDGTEVPGEENYITIQHDDGTFARYLHLSTNASFVQVGDLVEQGQVIALSGNSGNSSGPHLHLDLIDGNCGTQDISCHSLPITFLNTEAHDTGLAEDRIYNAEAY